MAAAATPEKPAAAPAVEPQKTPTTTETPAEAELRFSRDALEKRLDQAKRANLAAFLKAKGYDSEEAFEADRAKYAKLAKEAEKAEREKLSEIERIKADLADRDKKLAESEAARQQAVSAAEMAKTRAYLLEQFSSRGITKHRYAETMIEEAIDALGDGETMGKAEMEAFLDKLVADPEEAAALGLGRGAPRPAVTTTAKPKGPEQRPASTGPSKGTFTPDEMTPAQWQAWQRERGIF